MTATTATAPGRPMLSERSSLARWASTAPRSTKLTAAALAAILLVFLGYAAGLLTSRSSPPSDTSPEAGFARDMSEHHAQAVEMGMIAFQRASLPAVRTLGGDIALTQQGQIGVMNTWLKDWGLSPNSSRAPMAWMPEGERALNGNLMPGMANSDEMAKLRSATGRDVDILFCQYMLRHHLGGIHMVSGILAETANPDVTALAQAMHNGQTNEVQVLRQLLTTLNTQPLP